MMSRSSVLSRKVQKEALEIFLSEVRPVTTNHPLVRIGGDSDGGYLVPDDMDGIDACFSPGVADRADFELHMAARGIPCFMADYSVEKPPIQNPLFHFQKKYLGPVNDERFMTLEHWVNQCAPESRDLILQMDIEGYEFGVLLEAEASVLKRFRIMVIEFHRMHELWEARGYDLIRLTFLRLLKHFEIVHIHPNNCAGLRSEQGLAIPRMLEFTFLRKDRVSSKTPTTSFPHPLDRQNVQKNGKPDFPLPGCWYSKPG